MPGLDELSSREKALAKVLQDKTGLSDEGMIAIAVQTLMQVNPELLQELDKKPEPAHAKDAEEDDLGKLVKDIAAGNNASLELLHPKILQAVLQNDRETLETVDEHLVDVLKSLDEGVLKKALKNIGDNVVVGDGDDRIEKLVKDIAGGSTDALELLHPLILQAVLHGDEETLEQVDDQLVEVLKTLDPAVLEKAVDVINAKLSGSQKEGEDSVAEELIQQIAEGNMSSLEFLHPQILQAVLDGDEDTLATVDSVLVEVLMRLDAKILEKAITTINARLADSQVADNTSDDLVSQISRGNKKSLLRLHPKILDAVLKNKVEVLDSVDQRLVVVLKKLETSLLQNALDEIKSRLHKKEKAARACSRVSTRVLSRLKEKRDIDLLREIDPFLLEGFVKGDEVIVSEMSKGLLVGLRQFRLGQVEEVWKRMLRRAEKRHHDDSARGSRDNAKRRR